jgi:hypothetical protein
MKITTIGRGNIGGGLARLWEQAGHDANVRGLLGKIGRVFYRFAPPGEL